MNMEIKYVPEACRGKKAKYSGTITLLCPTFNERYQYIDDSGFDLDAKEEDADTMKQMRSLRKLVGMSEKHYVAVDIKTKDGNTQHTSFAEMANDPGCDAILIEIGSKMVSGFALGNG